MNLNLSLRLSALALLSLCTAAHAEVRNFKFFGTVSESSPMAPAGARITGTYSYDTAAEPLSVSGEQQGAHHGYAHYLFATVFQAQVNGHTVRSSSFYVDVTNNFGGNVEDSVNVYSSSITLDGTQFTEGSLNFGLASGPGKTKVLNNTDLPRKVAVKRFDGWTDGAIMIDGSSNGTVLSFKVDRVVVVHKNGKEEE